LEALGYGLHHSVLDAVVDHLHEMAGTMAVEESVAVMEREVCEERLNECEVLTPTANHQARAAARPARAAARSTVQEPDAVLREAIGPALSVLVVRVASVDHDIAGA